MHPYAGSGSYESAFDKSPCSIECFPSSSAFTVEVDGVALDGNDISVSESLDLHSGTLLCVNPLCVNKPCSSVTVRKRPFSEVNQELQCGGGGGSDGLTPIFSEGNGLPITMVDDMMSTPDDNVRASTSDDVMLEDDRLSASSINVDGIELSTSVSTFAEDNNTTVPSTTTTSSSMSQQPRRSLRLNNSIQPNAQQIRAFIGFDQNNRNNHSGRNNHQFGSAISSRLQPPPQQQHMSYYPSRNRPPVWNNNRRNDANNNGRPPPPPMATNNNNSPSPLDTHVHLQLLHQQQQHQAAAQQLLLQVFGTSINNNNNNAGGVGSYNNGNTVPPTQAIRPLFYTTAASRHGAYLTHPPPPHHPTTAPGAAMASQLQSVPALVAANSSRVAQLLQQQAAHGVAMGATRHHSQQPFQPVSFVHHPTAHGFINHPVGLIQQQQQSSSLLWSQIGYIPHQNNTFIMQQPPTAVILPHQHSLLQQQQQQLFGQHRPAVSTTIDNLLWTSLAAHQQLEHIILSGTTELLIGQWNAMQDRINKNRGMSRSEIQRLPAWRWRGPDDDGTTGGDDKCDDDLEHLQTSCVVCMGDFEVKQLVRKLPCRHSFHSKCVDKWLKSNRTCPICRGDAAKRTTSVSN